MDDANRCAYEAHGERCHYPGTWTSSTVGSDYWLCTQHSRNPSQAIGAEIVTQSRAYFAPQDPEDPMPAVREWLGERGLLRRDGEARGAYIGRLRDFCTAGQAAGPAKPGKAWARAILDRFADRDPTLPDVSFRYACEALHVSADDVRATRDHAGRNAA